MGKRLSVDVAGAGGNGSQFVMGLARMHLALLAVGHHGLQVELYDPDIVTEANVGRQLFSPSDIGQFKSAVLINRINCYYGLHWTAAGGKLSRSRADFLVGCVDSIAARRSLARTEATYWLDLGNRDRSGQVILGMPKDKTNEKDGTRPQTVMELFPELTKGRPKEDNTPSCSLAAALERQDLFINQSVATFGLQLLWSFLRTGQLVHQGFFINLETGKVVPIPVPQPEEPKPSKKGKPLFKVFGGKSAQAKP
jgi:PRTRC genetic system ThiF family protein